MSINPFTENSVLPKRKCMIELYHTNMKKIYNNTMEESKIGAFDLKKALEVATLQTSTEKEKKFSDFATQTTPDQKTSDTQTLNPIMTNSNVQTSVATACSETQCSETQTPLNSSTCSSDSDHDAKLAQFLPKNSIDPSSPEAPNSSNTNYFRSFKLAQAAEKNRGFSVLPTVDFMLDAFEKACLICSEDQTNNLSDHLNQQQKRAIASSTTATFEDTVKYHGKTFAPEEKRETTTGNVWSSPFASFEETLQSPHFKNLSAEEEILRHKRDAIALAERRAYISLQEEVKKNEPALRRRDDQCVRDAISSSNSLTKDIYIGVAIHAINFISKFFF